MERQYVTDEEMCQAPKDGQGQEYERVDGELRVGPGGGRHSAVTASDFQGGYWAINRETDGDAHVLGFQDSGGCGLRRGWPAETMTGVSGELARLGRVEELADRDGLEIGAADVAPGGRGGSCTRLRPRPFRLGARIALFDDAP